MARPHGGWFLVIYIYIYIYLYVYLDPPSTLNTRPYEGYKEGASTDHVGLVPYEELCIKLHRLGLGLVWV